MRKTQSEFCPTTPPKTIMVLSDYSTKDIKLANFLKTENKATGMSLLYKTLDDVALTKSQNIILVY